MTRRGLQSRFLPLRVATLRTVSGELFEWTTRATSRTCHRTEWTEWAHGPSYRAAPQAVSDMSQEVLECRGSIEISVKPTTWGCWWHHLFACPYWESYSWNPRMGWAGADHHLKWWTANQSTPYHLSHKSTGCFMYKGDCTCSILFRKMIVFPCGNTYEPTSIL